MWEIRFMNPKNELLIGINVFEGTFEDEDDIKKTEKDIQIIEIGFLFVKISFYIW